MKKALLLIVVGLLINVSGVLLSLEDVETYSTVAIVTGVVLEIGGAVLAGFKFFSRLLGF